MRELQSRGRFDGHDGWTRTFELAAEAIPVARAEAALLHAQQELALVVHRAEALDERVVLDAADRLDAVLARALLR